MTKRKHTYKLDNGRGTILVGEFDTYTETSEDVVAGWFGPASRVPLGTVDFIIDGGPVVTLDTVNGLPSGWAVELLGVQS